MASPAVPDLSWLLYVAGRLLDGARLNLDVVEINPPLIVWLNVPPALVARFLGVPDIQVYRAAVALAAILSLWFVARLLRREDPARGTLDRRLLLLLLAVVLFVLPLADFGQREHLLLIATLPYIVVAAARANRRAIPRSAAAVVGLAAGLGLALKPYFLLLPLLLEAWLAARRSVRPVRPETVAAAGVLLVYAGAVLVFGGDYLSLARAYGAEYVGYLRDPLLLTALAGQGAGIPLLALLAALALRGRGRRGAVDTAMLLATLALYASAVLQQKGWRYYFYPAMATGLVSLAIQVGRARGVPLSLAGRIYAAAAMAALAFVPVRAAADGLRELARPRLARFAADPDLPALAQAVRAAAPGGSLWALSINMASSFPLVREVGGSWTSRLPGLWLLESLYRDQLAGQAPLAFRVPEEQPPAERYLNRVVVEDLRRGRPDLILELRPAPDRFEWGTRRLDYVAYFSRDPAFAREFASYRPIADVGQYRIYRRDAAGAGADRAPPSGSGTLASPLRPLGAGVHVAPLGPADLLRALAFLAIFAVAFRALRRERLG